MCLSEPSHGERKPPPRPRHLTPIRQSSQRLLGAGMAWAFLSQTQLIPGGKGSTQEDWEDRGVLRENTTPARGKLLGKKVILAHQAIAW